jgi:hypothetical protein
MIKETLTLLNNTPNIFDFPQSTIDSFKIEESDREIFISTIKIFMAKAKNHFTNMFVDFHVKNDFKHVDIIRYTKYPLPAVYNRQTKRCVINLSAFGKRSVSNIESRDVYTLMVYGHVCSFLSAGVKIPIDGAEVFCEYITQMLLKIFAKAYGLSGSYVDLIPQFRFFTSLYIYTSFFGLSGKEAINRSTGFSRVDPKSFKTDLSKYDFNKIDDYLLAMSENEITPGLNIYKFLDRMIRNFGIFNLPIFEDLMRFSATMVASSINGNTYFSPSFQMYNPKFYLKINSIIENSIAAAMKK